MIHILTKIKTKTLFVLSQLSEFFFTLTAFILTLIGGIPPSISFPTFLLAVIADKLTQLIHRVSSKKCVHFNTSIEHMNVTKPQEFWNELEKRIKNGGI